MARKAFSCPNCDSEFCSAIHWWKPAKERVKDTFDAYKCHDCGQLTEAGTNKKLPDNWKPKREVKQAQPDLFGNVENLQDTIEFVPKLVESPAGLTIAVYMVPEHSPKNYREVIRNMMLEINRSNTGRPLPHWYKFRNIKRGKK